MPDPITSDFGPRVTSRGAGFHWGIDIRARTPQAVHAITGGTIETIKINDSGAGNWVKVSGIRYLHLSKKWSDIEFTTDEEGKPVIKIGDERELKIGNTLSQGDIFAYSGSSGTSQAHLHIDKGQPGPNPLRDLPYTGVASNIEVFELQPPGPQVSGKVKIIAGVKSCQAGGGACSGNSVPDLNEVKINVEGETVYNPKFDSRNADAGNSFIHLPGSVLKKGIYPISLGKETFVGIKDFTGGMRCGSETGQRTITVTATDLKDDTISRSKTVEVMPDPDVPPCDPPDDNYSPSIFSFFYSELIDYPEPDGGDEIVEVTKKTPIAVLKRGHYIDLEGITNRFGEEVMEVGIDFDPLVVSNYPLLIIPSTALYGMENSEAFRVRLTEYVTNGGTLLVLSQQRGYEYSVLPVPDGENPISGYGHTEDQGCQFASSYIDTWHQMMAALNKSTPSINVDGYFTSIPSNATVLLRRMKNGQPSAIMYPYGNGKVIATTLYSDFASGTSQAFQEEIALIRDIISWSKSPSELPEIKPIGSINLQLSIRNPASVDASSIRLHLLDPNRNTVFAQDIDRPLGAGQTVVVPFTYTTSTTGPFGIWWVEYELLDNKGEKIFHDFYSRRELLSGRFIVSNPPSTPAHVAQLSLSVQSDLEKYADDSTATFTIIVFNNSDIEKTVTVRYEAGSQVMTVPAKGSSNFTYTKTVTFSESTQWVLAHLYDENNRFLTSNSKSYWVYWPSVNVSVQTDKTIYAKGETVNLTLNLQNKQNASYATTLKIRVTDPSNNSIYNTSLDISLTANGTSTQNLSFTLPSTAQGGYYIVSVEAYDTTGKKIGGNSARFELPQSQISVTPNLPSTLTTGTNTIPFTLNNTGGISVSSGVLDITFKDPEGIVINTGSQHFSLGVGQSTTLNFPTSILSLKFGNYTLTYTQSDETRTGNPTTITIPNTSTIALSFDKPSYKVRETANLTIAITNIGKFNLDPSTGSGVSVTVSVPDANYTDSQTIALLTANNSQQLTYVILIPETMTAGQHSVNVTLTLPSGSLIAQSSTLTIPEPSLSIGYSGPTTLTAGDAINLTIENTGGVDTDFTCEVTLADSGTIIYQNTFNNTVTAGASNTCSFQIPNQAASGTYILARVLNRWTNKWTILNKLLTISGISASLSVKTDKDIYLSTENITSLSTITTGALSISDGNINLRVEALCEEPAIVYVSTPISGGWWGIGVLYFSREFTTQELDVSSYLPGLQGYLLEFTTNVQVDYVALRDSRGNIYTPTTAAIGSCGIYYEPCVPVQDVTAQVSLIDGIGTDVGFATWDNIPPDATNLALIMVAKGGGSLTTECTVWETFLPVNQSPSTTDTINTLIGALGVTGKLYLEGTFSNSLGQIIASSEYPFYVIDGDFAFIISTDKEVYKFGETITITGEVKNLSAIQADGVIIEMKDEISGSILYTATVNIPAGGSYPFIVTTTASAEGTYTLIGKVTQNNSTLVEITDQYEVAMPKATVVVSAPDVVGNEPFNINVEIKNESKVDATLQFTVDSSQFTDNQQITIPAGETKLIQYQQQISQNTDYTFTFTGDFEQTITKTVVYGLSASVSVGVSGVYPEGSVSIPVTITNTGQLDETLTIDYSLQPSALIQTKTYYLPKGASVTDTLYYDLTEGEYQLTANSQLPTTSAQASFSVKKDIKVDMTVSVGAQSNSMIPVTVNLTNIGYSEFNGSVQLSVVSGQETVVWNSEQSVIQLLTQNSQFLTFNINPSAIEPGNYTVKVELLDNSGQQIAVSSEQLVIKGAIFQITQLPPYQTFYPGQEATFTFTIKNTGNQEGAFDFNLKSYDLIDSTQTEWLAPGEEKTISFNFLLPDDLEEKDYFAEYELRRSGVGGQGSANTGQIKYHVAGINLNVSAMLDKQYYSEGETGHLTIQITDNRPQTTDINLFARVNYNGYESQQSFTLSGSQTLTFDIPLTQITGEKLFYGIYHESGRSIHLNSLYIYKAGDVITITTDKQVYNPGETITAVVSDQGSGVSGTMTLTAPNYTETFDFAGSATKSFTLPFTMTAGTYFINYQFTVDGSQFTGSHPFDVAGISVKVKEATLDRGKYASSDTLKLSLTIESNQNLSATLKTWIVDPEGKYTLTGETPVLLTSSEPLLLTSDFSLLTSVSGIHRLVYAIYSGDLLLVSGSEAFDVGDAVLLGLSTDKTNYPTANEPVTAIISAYGTIDANLELQLNGSIFQTQSLLLNGFVTLNIQLGTMQPGTHTLKVILTAGGLKSTKEITFTYALSLVDSDGDGMPDIWEETYNLNPNDSSDALLDSDNDGLNSLQEYQNSTYPNNPDTDNDQMPDGWEVAYGLSPNVNDAISDKDNDGYSNLQEYQSGSNPSDPYSKPNQPSVANAGSDQNVIARGVVTLNGSESYDPEGALITFLWRFINIPLDSNVTDASFSDVTSAKPTFTSDVDGTYVLELTVSDGQLQNSDTVSIFATTPNAAPNANAGTDQNVYTGITVYMDGSASNDPDNRPQPLSYLWSFAVIPSGSMLTDENISNRDQVNANFIPDVDGTYAVKLSVSDGELSSEDIVHIYATTPNVPPNANAGVDTNIYLGEAAQLDGSASNDHDNGPQPLSYSWRFVAVPTNSSITNTNLSNANTVSPSFIPDVVGTYVLELMISDGEDYAFDNVGISVVYSSPNPDFFLPPIENNRVFKLGSTIPVKFQLTNINGTYISTAVARILLQQYSANVPVGNPIDATSTIGADTGNFFRYDGTGNLYIYNLSAQGLSVGTWQIKVVLDDGTTKTVFIGLK